MANVWGLDVQEVRTLASQLETEAAQIDQILQKLTTTLTNTQWTGPDATQFRNDWQSAHTAKLRQVSQALKDAANTARQNATAQEQVSQG